MSQYQQRFIVQDLESCEFLCADNDGGGLDYTPYLSMAGKYDNYQDAFEAAVDEIGGEFAVFKFFEQIQ